jgi:2-methylcitrate dehydratase PrpD
MMPVAGCCLSHTAAATAGHRGQPTKGSSVTSLQDANLSTGQEQATTPALRTTDQLVDFAYNLTYDDLPEAVVQATKRVILDAIAVTVAAYDTPMAEALLGLKRDQGGRPDATLVVDGTKVPAPSSAYVHAQLANLFDADDTLLNRAHFACSPVWAALAVAERVGASGKDIITAVAAGFDITARIGCSLQQYTTNESGEVVFAKLFGYSWMSFGAATAAGKLLGLDRLQFARMYGQTFVTTPLIYDIWRQCAPQYKLGEEGNWHKYQVSGAAAEAGINAAIMAAHGQVAQTDVFDEGSEFWRSFGAAGCNWNMMYDDLATRWFIAETSIKPYPFCRYGHTALDLFGAILQDEKLSADEIEGITVRAGSFAHMQNLSENVHIDDPISLMVSLPTACALMVYGKPAGPQWWHADFTDPDLMAFASKVAFEISEEASEVMAEQLSGPEGGIFIRRIPTEVIVRARGTEFRRFDEYAFGDQWEPAHAMQDADVAEKFRRFTDGLLPSAQAEAVIDGVLNLESAADLTAIAKAWTA